MGAWVSAPGCNVVLGRLGVTIAGVQQTWVSMGGADPITAPLAFLSSDPLGTPQPGHPFPFPLGPLQGRGYPRRLGLPLGGGSPY